MKELMVFRDSDNSNPPAARLENGGLRAGRLGGDEKTVKVHLSSPERVVVLSVEDLKRALEILS